MVEKGGLWWQWKREKSTSSPESKTIEVAAMAAIRGEERLWRQMERSGRFLGVRRGGW